MYASNSVHHMPTDINPTSNNSILNSIMSSSHHPDSTTQSINVSSGDCLVHSNGSLYTVKMDHVTYLWSQAISDSIGSLLDRGANGGLASADIHVLKYTKQYADTTGVGQASISALQLVTYTRTVHTTQGPVVLIMNQYAYYGETSTVHSAGQLSDFGLDMDDQSSQAMHGYT